MCRSDVDNTTSINGIHQQDPLGPHVTICYKDEHQLPRVTRVASHGYVRGKDDLTFVCATHAREKADSAKRQRERKTVWPSEDELEAVPEIAYIHLATN
ncbi:uncharacterized protein N7479_006612 [Penicillium vulpinum]|uniref:uncharacterized protein n=1 Tax=Penicillium vulpinum TaxID=29845 RepID=UPI0025469700|nr:uncharacterized protein N7479_006612 [Penicillium vulpinum]KAJ5959462.1 hypothetical protein N7479_006612 [Penicillium vulpinum]